MLRRSPLRSPDFLFSSSVFSQIGFWPGFSDFVCGEEGFELCMSAYQTRCSGSGEGRRRIRGVLGKTLPALWGSLLG